MSIERDQRETEHVGEERDVLLDVAAMIAM
jgi:hypothetical protein